MPPAARLCAALPPLLLALALALAYLLTVVGAAPLSGYAAAAAATCGAAALLAELRQLLRAPPPAAPGSARGGAVATLHYSAASALLSGSRSVPRRRGAAPRRVSADFAERCRQSNPSARANIVRGYDLTPRDYDILARGDSLFGFLCKPGAALTAEDRALFSSMLNLSAFADEAAQNREPHVDLENDAARFTFFLTRSMYVIPGVRAEDFSVDVLTRCGGVDFHRACQPGQTRVWDDWKNNGVPDTFRITKTIIRFVYACTIQVRCSELPAHVLPTLRPLFGGLEVDRAILLERAMRAQDSPGYFFKVKSLLLFHRLPGDGDGFLQSNPTALCIGALPRPLAAFVNACGSFGAGDVAETATLTRRYLTRPDVRPAAPRLHGVDVTTA